MRLAALFSLVCVVVVRCFDVVKENQLKSPETCSLEDCTYFLQWNVVSSKQIDFFLSAQTQDHNPWVAVGFGDKRAMPGSSVVECISTPEKFIIQASYNKGYKNELMQNSQLGLIPGSLSGEAKSNRVYCNFSHVVQVSSYYPEFWKVKPLDIPIYVFIARGPANSLGLKKKHHKHPFISDSKINFLHPNGSGETSRPKIVTAHGSMMVVVWMFVMSLGTVASRYFKEDWLQGLVIRNKPIWFQVHRYSALSSAVLIIISILLIAEAKEWTFYPSVHSILGLSVVSLVGINIISGFLRPDVTRPKRRYFRYFHGFLGHLLHFLGFVTLHFGLRHPNSLLPKWVSWIPIGFGVFKIFMDVILSLLKYKHPGPNYVELVINNNVSESGAWSWRYSVAISYLLISFGASLAIIIALNFSPVFLQ